MIFHSPFPPLRASRAPYGTVLLEALWRNAIDAPEKPALINAEDHADQVTYRNLYVHALSVASFLKDHKFGHGDVAAFCMPNKWQFVPILAGVALRGAAISGASYQFTEFELERQFKDCRCKIVFCSEETFQKTTNSARKCPLIQMIVVVTRINSKFESSPGILTFDQVLATKPDVHSHEIDIDVKRDVVFLPYSSGTTGNPKGVMLSHQNLNSQMELFSRHLEDHLLQPVDLQLTWKSQNHLIFAPLYHVFGFTFLQSVLLHGGTAVLMAKFDFALYCRTIERFKVKLIGIVPPILVLLAKSPLVEQFDLSSLKILFCGGAPAGRELCEDVRTRMPHIKFVSQGYGMTEITLACTLPVYGTKQTFGNVGQIAASTQVRIVDTVTQKPLEPEQRGEIYVKSASVMLGYLNRPEATAAAIDDDGWLRTGDIGFVDRRGFLFIVDRLKELIKVKGLQVPPAELEDLLLTHPLIEDAAVVGVPHERDGERPMAFVVRANEALCEEEVRKYVADRVAPYKQLKGGVHFLPQIPKSPSGKILRRFLRDEAAALRKAAKL